MIQSFRGKFSKSVSMGRSPKGFPANMLGPAMYKLTLLDVATSLDELRFPPGNRLEALKGDRNGQHSIRINAQWRVCFEWRDGGAWDVEIVDYH